MSTETWCGPSGELGRFVTSESESTLASYREQPKLVTEHALSERDTSHGGYQHRQMYELVQNAADALWVEQASERSDRSHADEHAHRGRIEVRLTERCLYCADDGDPIDRSGMTALMFSHMSPKRATNQIGTFGLGFKAVLGVSDEPEFFSRSGSFRFERLRSSERIRAVVPSAAALSDFPVLRLPEPINPLASGDSDSILGEMMSWASNIVRLPLKPKAYGDLDQQIANFPAEFVLFVPHVTSLTLIVDGRSPQRSVRLAREGGEFVLDDGVNTGRWRVFRRSHRLSADARADRRPGDHTDDVLISWAAPIDHIQRHDHFWAHFPTETSCLASGILNAPWKTNEDRQNLLTGEYNDELVRAASALIADELPSLSYADDPAHHLDLLPRRHERGDNHHASLLRVTLNQALASVPVVPDQGGDLRSLSEINYPPESLHADRDGSAALERWAAHVGKPRDWLHHGALNRSRTATIDRLFDAKEDQRRDHAEISEWLEALVEDNGGGDAAAASRAAIQTAALLPTSERDVANLGHIVLTASGEWRSPNPVSLFLPPESPQVGDSLDRSNTVHRALTADEETLAALRKLGLRQRSAEDAFRAAATALRKHSRHAEAPAQAHEDFWQRSRALGADSAFQIVQDVFKGGLPRTSEWHRRLRVRTLSGAWQPADRVLQPGKIVQEDGERDADVVVDQEFHTTDRELLDLIGVRAGPIPGCNLASDEQFRFIRQAYEREYRQRSDLPSSPQQGMLLLEPTRGVGPLAVMGSLSEEGLANYTEALLREDATFDSCTMRHATRPIYPEMTFESPALHAVREHGRIRTLGGIARFADALGSPPVNPDALDAVFRHANAAQIKEAFDLSDPSPEVSGEASPTPLLDVWPGLQRHLSMEQAALNLVRCGRIVVAGQERECALDSADVYLVGDALDDEQQALGLVARSLGLSLSAAQMTAIAERRTPAEVQERRERVHACSSDAERLLAAVGADALRARLPASLVSIVEQGHADPAALPIAIAESAIATYHTGTLREFRAALNPLDPPKQWAGSRRAVEFVRALGFSEEWAGEPGHADDPFEQVEGPLKLGELHGYQRAIADRLKQLLDSTDQGEQGRRGLISLPTGAGKTRVAVQAIVEARRDQSFLGNVLWVADRRELCEQAVQAWRQVWRSEGIEDARLRVSRLWGGNAAPTATDDWHVIVASIQTLHARLSNQRLRPELLDSVGLVVFDEAHRSIARTYTSAMAEIGLTSRQTEDEPALLGLTATPYRGHNEAETLWLANRYGQNRLDTGAFESDDPHCVIAHLQDTAVLANVDHELIAGGTYELTQDEQTELAKFGGEAAAPRPGFLPTSVEERIAEDAARTQRILDAYKRHVRDDWPALIFATSVDHSKTLAALLTLRGVTARAVSGGTDTATRSRVVDGFRSGEINVLVNYGVFREGFDAPKTRAIIVARPVYSPNLYFQMVGRGLRGPLNGGDERCLILNVQDNIENYGEQLAFADVDWLWSR